MKELIYLDTGFLNSFIAQKEGGLPYQTNQETHQQESRKQTTDTADQSDYKPSLNLGFAQYVYDRTKSKSEGIEIADLDAAKEVVSKLWHDNSLEEFEKYLCEKELIKDISVSENNLSSGTYIRLRSSFRLVDITFLKNVFGKAIVEIMESINQHDLNEALTEIENTPNLNKQQKNAQIKAVERLNKQEQDSVMYGFKLLQQIFNYLTTILPTEIFIKMGHFVAPLKDGFLRETPQEINFKYGSENPNIKITLLGKVTRKFDYLVDQEIIRDDDGEFGNIAEGMNGAIQKVFDITNLIQYDDYIISPIAIYFEGDDAF